MAGLAGSLGSAPRPCHSCSPLLAGDVYLHYLTDLPLQPIFDQPDIHDELHDIVSGEMAEVWASANIEQDADCPSLRVPDLMDRSLPIHEHVHTITTRAAEKRTSH